jgi:hypothetical protein
MHNYHVSYIVGVNESYFSLKGKKLWPIGVLFAPDAILEGNIQIHL